MPHPQAHLPRFSMPMPADLPSADREATARSAPSSRRPLSSGHIGLQANRSTSSRRNSRRLTRNSVGGGTAEAKSSESWPETEGTHKHNAHRSSAAAGRDRRSTSSRSIRNAPRTLSSRSHRQLNPTKLSSRDSTVCRSATQSRRQSRVDRHVRPASSASHLIKKLSQGEPPTRGEGGGKGVEHEAKRLGGGQQDAGSGGGGKGLVGDVKMGGKNNIKVAIRVRPMNPREKAIHSKEAVTIVDENVVVLRNPAADSGDYLRSKRAHEKRYAFDYAFGQRASQRAVYEKTTQFLLEGVMDGYNATVFAYGATGAGKTFTMTGTRVRRGIMALTLEDMFGRIARDKENVYSVSLSYVEIYNEYVRDLLSPSDSYLELREDPIKGMVVAGVTELIAESADDVMELLAMGNENRSTERTGANLVSSRSHGVLQIVVEKRKKTANTSHEYKVGKLSMIDLAGSERASVTNNRGMRMVEGANINRSLLALANCINALGKDVAPSFVPYRDSKLTRLLKDSLGGNTKTVMIAAMSPTDFSYEDTHNTLKYANRAKNIRTKVQQNVHRVDYHISRYTDIIKDLNVEVKNLKSQLAQRRAGGVGGGSLVGPVSTISTLASHSSSNFNLNVEEQRCVQGLRHDLHSRISVILSVRQSLSDLEELCSLQKSRIAERGEAVARRRSSIVANHAPSDLDALRSSYEKNLQEKLTLKATLVELKEAFNAFPDSIQGSSASSRVQEIMLTEFRVHNLQLSKLEYNSSMTLFANILKEKNASIDKLENQIQLRDKIMDEHNVTRTSVGGSPSRFPKNFVQLDVLKQENVTTSEETQILESSTSKEAPTLNDSRQLVTTGHKFPNPTAPAGTEDFILPLPYVAPCGHEKRGSVASAMKNAPIVREARQRDSDERVRSPLSTPTIVYRPDAPVIRSRIMSPFRPPSGVLPSRPLSRASISTTSSHGHGHLIAPYQSYSTDVSPQAKHSEAMLPVMRNLVDHLNDAQTESYDTHTMVATSGNPIFATSGKAMVATSGKVTVATSGKPGANSRSRSRSPSTYSTSYTKPTPIKYYNENRDPTEHLSDITSSSLSPSSQSTGQHLLEESTRTTAAASGISPQKSSKLLQRYKNRGRGGPRNRLAPVPENQRSNVSLRSNASSYEKRVGHSRSPNKGPRAVGRRAGGERSVSRSPSRPVMRPRPQNQRSPSSHEASVGVSGQTMSLKRRMDRAPGAGRPRVARQRAPLVAPGVMGAGRKPIPNRFRRKNTPTKLSHFNKHGDKAKSSIDSSPQVMRRRGRGKSLSSDESPAAGGGVKRRPRVPRARAAHGRGGLRNTRESSEAGENESELVTSSNIDQQRSPENVRYRTSDAHANATGVNATGANATGGHLRTLHARRNSVVKL